MREGHEDVLKVLLQAGANTETRSTYVRFPFSSFFPFCRKTLCVMHMDNFYFVRRFPFDCFFLLIPTWLAVVLPHSLLVDFAVTYVDWFPP